MKYPEKSILNAFTTEKPINHNYKWLYQYHYRTSHTGPVAGVWVLNPRKNCTNPYVYFPIGVIIYGMPSANQAGRNRFASCFLEKRTQSERLREMNRRLRTIRRVIIAPAFRGLGLATKLVRDTLPLIGTEFVESYTVSGENCGFFQKAGMERFSPPIRPETTALQNGLRRLGISESLWWDSREVYNRLSGLNRKAFTEADHLIENFLKPYKNKRGMNHSMERIRFVLSRLSGRPTYYFWQNTKTAENKIRAA